MNRWRWILAMVAVTSLVTACSSDPNSDAPEPGTLVLSLTTPHADDGAMLFTVSGPSIDSVIAANPSLRLFTRRVNGSTVTGAVVGDLANGAVVRLQVPDVGGAAGYTARVLEVADRQNALRASLTDYSLAVVP